MELEEFSEKEAETHERIQDLVKGAQNILSIFAESVQWRCVNEVSPNWPGPGPALGPWKLLGFSFAFSSFWGTFFYYF